MSTLREKIIEEYIDKSYPNAKITNFDDSDSGLTFYRADELQNVDEDWFPLCCYKDEETGQAVYGGRKEVYHTYTEGETGAGKTTRFVMQAIYSLASLKVKPSFIIADMHGEIIENEYNHLKKNGYNVIIINCDNPARSHTYNPLSGLAKECCRTKQISCETENALRRIAEIIQPVEASQDPIWDQGARSYTNGAILDKFEDLINGDIPPSSVNIYNIIQNHYRLRKQLENNHYGPSNLLMIEPYDKKGMEALSVQKMISVTNNAEKTRASYFGVVENHYDAFGQSSLYSLSSTNSVDIDEFIDKPTAIVIQAGSTQVGEHLISLMMNDIYTAAVKRGRESKLKRLPRNIHCFLDEFANCNIADGPEFIKMLTTSRKFGMFWHMFLQCDAQLDRKYDADIGRIIRANCTEIFMGSHDYNTMQRFAHSCGKKTIETLASQIEQQTPRFETVDLITTDSLNLTPKGFAYVKSNRHSLLKTYIEPFYTCDEFEPVEDIDSVYPHNDCDYRKTAFFYEDMPPEISRQEYDILKFIADSGEITLDTVTDHFDIPNISNILISMIDQKIISIPYEQPVKILITEQQMNLYDNKAQNDLLSGAPAPVSENESRTAEKTSAHSSSANKKRETKSKASHKKEKKTTHKNNDIFEDLRKHLEGADIRKLLKKIKHITSIADILYSYLNILTLPQAMQEVSEPESLTEQELAFDIIEALIRHNSFSTKQEWEDKLSEEYEFLSSEKIFPLSVMKEYKTAVEFFEALPLSDIESIKKRFP